MIEMLDKLQYSTDRTGPWGLYIFGLPGSPGEDFHGGKQWFGKEVRYPDEEISVHDALVRVNKALQQGREIRVTDGGDMLVYHAVEGKAIYGIAFWRDICT